MDFDFREELIEDERYFIKKSSIENEIYNSSDDQHRIIGSCKYCTETNSYGKQIPTRIYADDVDFVVHEEGTGICHKCLHDCIWKGGGY